MNIIFVADIFGRTDDFTKLCQQVTTNVEQLLKVKQPLGVKCQLHLIGPYSAQTKLFSSEEDAYQYFIENVTLEGYVKKLEQKLSAISGSKLLVGFSIGGSAIWQLYSQKYVEQSLAAICFYSSQIRHMTQLAPNIVTKLILPATEQHFSVAALRTILQEKSMVTIEQSEYLHGFMNTLSKNYDRHAYQYYTKRLAELLLEQYLNEEAS
ncbi:MAG: dienelactone hydrolase [Cognaticolwellia sp.]